MGVFQIESRAQIQTLPRTQPRNLDDLAVQVAIIRPGPIMAGAFHPYMEYREKLARGETVDVDYGHPELAPLLKDCLGRDAWSRALPGPGAADLLRGRRLHPRPGRPPSPGNEPQTIVRGDAGASPRTSTQAPARQGVSRDAAKVAFDRMAAFAAFGFPKSHAVAFALLAYESCWLRYYYPAAYYCSLFNAQPMGFYSIEVLTNDARRHGIEVLPPSINRSRAGAWPETGNIRLGLEQVKGLGGGWRTARQHASG